MRSLRYYRSVMPILIVGLISTGAVQGASLQFVVFCDTLDPTIGTIEDLNRSTAWAETISSYTGLDLHLQSLSGEDLTPANARNLLEALNPAVDDVVYFVYSGHGANPGNSQWPMFTFMADTCDAWLTFDEVVSILQPKPQRMLIVVSDCCNVTLDSNGRNAPRVDPAGQSALTALNFRRLFVDVRGTVLATAASVGQYSLGDPSGGGLFLSTYMNNLNSLADSEPSLTWERVLGTTANDVSSEVEFYVSMGELDGMETQQPHYVIDIEQVAGYTPDPPDTSGTEPTTGGDSDTDAQSGLGCGSAGVAPLVATALGCFALRVRRRTCPPRP
jgi:hypothetical protein